MVIVMPKLLYCVCGHASNKHYSKRASQTDIGHKHDSSACTIQNCECDLWRYNKKTKEEKMRKENEKFPELKGKVVFAEEFVLGWKKGEIPEDGNRKYMEATEKKEYVALGDVESNCLSKQRVREILKLYCTIYCSDKQKLIEIIRVYGLIFGICEDEAEKELILQ